MSSNTIYCVGDVLGSRNISHTNTHLSKTQNILHKFSKHKITACHTVQYGSNKLGYDMCRLHDDDNY